VGGRRAVGGSHLLLRHLRVDRAAGLLHVQGVTGTTACGAVVLRRTAVHRRRRAVRVHRRRRTVGQVQRSCAHHTAHSKAKHVKVSSQQQKAGGEQDGSSTGGEGGGDASATTHRYRAQT
jgi:hypothetical protein